ncbi:DNA replication licensing factor MCM7-like [Hevea brasiliensis]|uniref:DNA replication licensing factor MCM7-like n=1 Tax=Hevea brasiliensis TaxID=3981 RepID=UPI0025FCD562|nr:DNA replication licensing factor MCM7-like [Hevea brasiliensis]
MNCDRYFFHRTVFPAKSLLPRTSTSTQTKDFISNFADANGEAKYMNILQDLANHKSRAVKIDFEDLLNYKDLDEEFFRPSY